MFMTILPWILLGLMAAYAVYHQCAAEANYATAASLDDERCDALDKVGFLEAETERLHESLADAHNELSITKAFSVYVEHGRDAARKSQTILNGLIDQMSDELKKVQAERDELQADIGLVAGRRAKWRERAEKAEAALINLEVDLEIEQARVCDLDEDIAAQDQALMYAEEERQILKDQLARENEMSEALFQDCQDASALRRKVQSELDGAKMALTNIASLVNEPTKAVELLRNVKFDDTLEGQTTALVAAGLQDFVALVTERNELIQALGEAQNAQAKPSVIASPGDPFGLTDLPF